MVDNSPARRGPCCMHGGSGSAKRVIATAGRTVDIIAELGGRHGVEHSLRGPRRRVASKVYYPPLRIAIGQHRHACEFEPDCEIAGKCCSSCTTEAVSV